ncbi:MAG: trypsin-like peptidase domain-containing protein [Clostridium sp.]|jgi:serine protease Do|nr:trypsin-like peptidase domain-containing protein [Clostridium sp.]MCI7031225.1 trypsin-like peptidase domain-containing protein [Clostridium sp.]MDD7683663.1 trypsin-like peptidase domain-containing protein [Clostridium sp.]MDY2581303.1 trypsin-like peptidase domain-containing protein [Clostridium sp.]
MDDKNIYDVVYSSGKDNNNDTYNFQEPHVKAKKKRGFNKTIAGVVVCTLCSGFIGSGVTYLALKNNLTQTKTININPATFDTESEALSATEAYNKVAPAAVVVSTKSVTQGYFMHTQEVEGIGSGFIINEEGYILTNYHVIQGAQEISVTLSNDVTTTAQVVNYDENQDVAMIKITDESVEIPATVELGDSDALQPGEEVIAIGTPLSTELSSTVTKGIISATSRSVAVESGVTMNLIQTDAAINAGNSGGPLVNTKGEVVGINSSKISGEAVEGIGFSIPINDIKDKIESLSKPILNLGISVRTIDESLSKQLNMEQGLYIVEVTEFSSAEKAGLKAGDIIVKADGTRITTFDEFKEIKNAKEEGDDISLEVVRNGESKTINVTLTAS